MLGTILVIIIVVSGFLILFLSKSNKTGKNSWVQFFAKGKDSGFSLKEIELLRRLAIKCSLEDPSSLFWSQNQLDLCIRNLVRTVRLSGGGDQATQDFLSKLYDYRKKIEMEKPRNKNGITQTRQIEEGQEVRILLGGYGVFNSKIIRNTAQYMILIRPNSSKFPLGFSWKGQKLSVYFWREEDAGYVFDTEVEDEIFSRGENSLKAGQGESLFRTQKRKSIRIKTHKPAFLYVLENGESSTTIESLPGIKSFIEDLSDTGCAMAVGGKAPVGLRVKVQFMLNNIPVCISGTVRSLEYDEDINRSLLHVEADPMSLETRNTVMGEVFGMLPEEAADELPFKVIDEDIEKENAENSAGDQSVLNGEAL